MIPNNVILGAGMSGLLAAKACRDMGEDYLILEVDPFPREQLGLHYLHDPCGCPVTGQKVYNIIVGQQLGYEPFVQYAKKMGISENNSLKGLPATVDAWHFQDAYDYLWNMAAGAGKIMLNRVTPELVDLLLEEGRQVFNTVPLHKIRPEARCDTQTIYVSKKIPEGMEVGFMFNKNLVVYNIDLDVDWYRFSLINGTTWTESRECGEISVNKVVSTNYKPKEDNLHLIGRLGAWNKKWLAHDSYYAVKDIIERQKNDNN